MKQNLLGNVISRTGDNNLRLVVSDTYIGTVAAGSKVDQVVTGVDLVINNKDISDKEIKICTLKSDISRGSYDYDLIKRDSEIEDSWLLKVNLMYEVKEEDYIIGFDFSGYEGEIISYLVRIKGTDIMYYDIMEDKYFSLDIVNEFKRISNL